MDDFVITGHKEAITITRFKSEISREWEMTDEGRLFWCLNLLVTRDMDQKLLKIDQSQYVMEILHRFNMDTANTHKTPMREKREARTVCG